MAYSSIGHMGYALIGLAVGTPEGIRGVLIYMVIYVFMSAGTFACIIAMRRRGRALEQISDLSGLARTDPGLALAMAVFMFSMAGIPPLSGFFGKLYIFLAAVQAGMWTLAVIGVLTSVVGAYYYMRVVKVMYFDAPEAPFDPRPASLSFVAAATGCSPRSSSCSPHRSSVRRRRRPRRCSCDASAMHPPCCSSSTAGNTNVVFAVHDGDTLARHLAHPHRRAAHLGRIRASG